MTSRACRTPCGGLREVRALDAAGGVGDPPHPQTQNALIPKMRGSFLPSLLAGLKEPESRLFPKHHKGVVW